MPPRFDHGDVVINRTTGVAGRVRGWGWALPYGGYGGPGGWSISVETGRTGERQGWMERDCMSHGEFNAQEVDRIRDEELARRRDQDEIAKRAEQRSVERETARVDRRLRTPPHGDALDTTVRYAVNGGRGVPGLAFDEFAGLMNEHPGPFRLHAHQRRFLEMVERGERPIVLGARRSSGWPAVFEMAGLIKERLAPWRADAAAAENGMGC